MITAAQVRAAAKARVNESNMNSVMIALDQFGPAVGLDLPHRETIFLSQLMHESGNFRYDRELWGPTPAQKRYDTRTDLGNTPEADGDGFKNRGRGPIQLTGGYNIRAFHVWCVEKGFDPPDFVSNPDLINTDPWEGLSAIWYWSEGNPDGRSLNRYADRGDLEMVTRKINGGLNGYADRLDNYTRLGLVVLGFHPEDLASFQRTARASGKYKGNLDGLDGPQTRAAIHMSLAALGQRIVPAPQMPAAFIKASPVTEVEDRPVVPDAVETQVKKKFNLLGWVAGLFSSGGLGALGLAGIGWQEIVAIGGMILLFALVALVLRHYIISGIKEIKQAVES